MCMKNLNANIIIGTLAGDNNVNGIDSLLNISAPIKWMRLGDEFIIPKLSFLLAMTAVTEKEVHNNDNANNTVAEKNVQMPKIDARTTIDFNSTYEIRIRLTHVKTNHYLDLEEFSWTPRNDINTKCQCKDIAQYSDMYHDILNISVKGNPSNDIYVLKTIIRLKDPNESSGNWFVQSITQLSFEQ